jgi:hypothetical protein
MNRLLRALAVVLLFEMGALLLYLPWSSFWEQNYFFSQFPGLVPLVLHPSVRGIISGIGVLDILLAFGLFSSRAAPASAPPQSNS